MFSGSHNEIKMIKQRKKNQRINDIEPTCRKGVLKLNKIIRVPLNILIDNQKVE